MNNQPHNDNFTTRALGWFVGGYLEAFFKLIPFFTRMGCLGYVLALLFVGLVLGGFMLAILGILAVIRMFFVSDSGQIMILGLWLGGLAVSGALWLRDQTRTSLKLLRLLASAVLIALILATIIASGLIPADTLQTIIDRATENPLQLVIGLAAVFVSLLMVAELLVGYTRDLFKDAFKSPLKFLAMLWRLLLTLLMIGAIVLVISLNQTLPNPPTESTPPAETGFE